MFVIRASQMDSLRAVADDGFVRRVAAHLLTAHADVAASFSEHELLNRIRQGIARARAYGMAHEATLTVFVVTMLRSTPRFDQHPLVKRYLDDQEIGIESRLSVMLASLDDLAWEAIIAETGKPD